MKKSLKRPSNKIDLSHMRHPKPLEQRSRSSSLSPNARKSKSNFTFLSKSKPKQNDKYSEILHKVLSIQISNKTNHVLLRKHLTSAIEPHILILNEAIKSRDEIGKNLLKNGKFLKKCCEILQQNPYYKFGSLLQFIRKTNIPNLVQHKFEFQKYYESKLQNYNQSQQEPIVTKYDLNGNQIKNIPITNQSNKKQDNKESQVSDEQSAIVIKYDLNGNQIHDQLSPSIQPQQKFLSNIPTQHLFLKQTPEIFDQTQQFPNINKLMTNLQAIPKKGILKPSKYKLSQTPQQSAQTNSNNQLYPDFDDYNQLLNEKQNNPKDNLPQNVQKIDNSINPQITQLTYADKMKNAMMKVFRINTIYNIEDLNIVGIIETDYDQMGQYGVLLVSEKKDKDKRQILVVLPLKTQVNQEALQKVKSRFASILGWIVNNKNIDLNQYWAQNLDNILPS